MRLAALRRTLLPAVAALVGATATVSAQTSVSVAYAPTCNLGAACSDVRFTIVNAGPSLLSVSTLSLTASSPAFRFAPSGGGSVSVLQAVDSFGPLSGNGTLGAGGTQLAINFVTGSGFPFELVAGGTGHVEVALQQNPVLLGGAFSYTGTSTGGPIAGSVAILPEPSTYALLATGLGTIGLVARRRRRAA